MDSRLSSSGSLAVMIFDGLRGWARRGSVVRDPSLIFGRVVGDRRPV